LESTLLLYCKTNFVCIICKWAKNNLIDKTTFTSIKFPIEENASVARLQEKFNRVVEIVKQSKRQYQHLYSDLLNEHKLLMQMLKYTSSKSRMVSEGYNDKSEFVFRTCKAELFAFKAFTLHPFPFFDTLFSTLCRVFAANWALLLQLDFCYTSYAC